MNLLSSESRQNALLSLDPDSRDHISDRLLVPLDEAGNRFNVAVSDLLRQELDLPRWPPTLVPEVINALASEGWHERRRPVGFRLFQLEGRPDLVFPFADDVRLVSLVMERLAILSGIRPTHR
jgi:hypothetical protein